MGEQRNNCKIEIKSKLCKNGSHKDEPADSGWCPGLLKRNEEEDEYSWMILLALPSWHAGTPKPKVPGWNSIFATSSAKLQDCFQDFITLLFVQEWLPCYSPEHSLLLSEDRKDKSLLTQCTHTQLYPSLCFCLASLFSVSLPNYAQSEMSPVRGVTSLYPWVLLQQEGFNRPSSPIPLSFPCKRWCVFVNPFLQTSEVFQTEEEIIFPIDRWCETGEGQHAFPHKHPWCSQHPAPCQRLSPCSLAVVLSPQSYLAQLPSGIAPAEAGWAQGLNALSPTSL